MNVVDSSGWLEYFADGPDAAFFAPTIQEVDRLVVPTLTLQEVFRVVFGARSEGDALQTVAAMQQGTIVPLDIPLALEAGRLSRMHSLSRESAVVLATARRHGADVWTQSAELRDLDKVHYRMRSRRG